MGTEDYHFLRSELKDVVFKAVLLAAAVILLDSILR